MKFKRLGTKQEVDLVLYVMEYLNTNPDGSIYVATDSQFRDGKVKYASVVVLHNGRGAQVLYDVNFAPLVGFDFEEKNLNRLRKETEYSAKLATLLRDEIGVKEIKQVELDFNEDANYKSNKVILEAIGWIKGLGLNVAYKTSELYNREMMASYAADRIAKNSIR